MRPRLPVLEPITKGILLSLISVAGATLGAAFVIGPAPLPSPEFMRTLATIGASLVLAYVIEAVWLATRVEVDDDHEEWLGFITGVGIAGLFGVAIALLLSEHRAAGHDNVLDDLGLAWSAVSQVILGGVLLLQPLLAYRLGNDGQNDRST